VGEFPYKLNCQIMKINGKVSNGNHMEKIKFLIKNQSQKKTSLLHVLKNPVLLTLFDK